MDKALRGRGLLGVGKAKRRRPSPSRTRQPRKEEMTGDELLGVYATGGWKGKPHSTKEGRIASGTRRIKRLISADKKAAGGRIGLKKGGSDKKWIQKAVNPKHKGYCTPMTKKTCTPARKALARTFKKKAKTGWG